MARRLSYGMLWLRGRVYACSLTHNAISQEVKMRNVQVSTMGDAVMSRKACRPFCACKGRKLPLINLREVRHCALGVSPNFCSRAACRMSVHTVLSVHTVSRAHIDPQPCEYQPTRTAVNARPDPRLVLILMRAHISVIPTHARNCWRPDTYCHFCTNKLRRHRCRRIQRARSR